MFNHSGKKYECVNTWNTYWEQTEASLGNAECVSKSLMPYFTGKLL